VQLVREEPFVFIINDFLSAAECEMLIAMIHSSQQQPSATASAQEERRTSTSMYPNPDEVQVRRQEIY
jgi:UTP-glucose-1-phosphate uridylyltransferase